MSKKGGLSDTQEIRRPKVPDPHTNGKSGAPHTAIRRASMTGATTQKGKTMPTRRPPTAGKAMSAKTKQDHQKKNRQKASKSDVFKRVLIVLICLLGAVFTMYSANVLTAVNRFIQAGVHDDANVNESARDKKVHNILLIGNGKSDPSGHITPASVVILSVSSRNQSVTLTPILLDSYVSIPGHKTDRLSEAFAAGGAELLIRTITSNFGIFVDSYFSYSPSALEKTVDLLGGLNLDVSEAERNHVNQRLIDAQANNDLLNSAGAQNLNGKQILAYSRFQNSGSTPFAQAERQKKIIQALISKLKQMSLGCFSEIRDSAFPEIQTNLSVGSMYLLSLKLPYYMLRYRSQTMLLPADGTWSEQTTPEGKQVLAVDFDANTQIFRDAVTMPLK